MSTAFASRLAQLIGLPKAPTTPNKHDQDGDDDSSWFTPYTGPYEPPPSQARASTSHSALDRYPEWEYEDYFAAHPHPYSNQLPHRTYHADEDAERDVDRGHASKRRSAHSPLLRSMESKRHGTGQGSGPVSEPSFLSGAGAGAIGESPVASHAQVAKGERAAHRSSFGSFMTFGGRRASHTPQTHQPPLSLTMPPHPLSAQPATSSFPEVILPSPERYHHADNLFRVSTSSSPERLHTPPLTRNLTHAGFHTAPRPASPRARSNSHVNMPSRSFFDTSVLTKADSPLPPPAPTPTPTPMERVPPVGAFAHPFAATYLAPRHAPPVRPNPNPSPELVRNEPRRPITSPGEREREREREQERERERERKRKGKQRAVPGLELGLGIRAPAPAAASNAGRTIKTSVSTPNLRGAFHRVSSRERDEDPHHHRRHHRHHQKQPPQRPQRGRPSTSTSATTSGGGIWGERTLTGQTLCDTFFFPRPRLQAHAISPPLTPETNLQQPQSNPQPNNPGPSRPTTMRPRASSLRWLRREPSAPELRPPLPSRMEPRSELERVVAEGERLNRVREEWREFAGRGLGNERGRERSKSRSRKNSLRSTTATAKDGGKEAGSKEGLGLRARTKSLRGKFSMELLKAHSHSHPHSQAYTSSGGTYTTTTGSGGTGGTHSRGPSSGGDAHHSTHHQARNTDHAHHGHSRGQSWSKTAIQRATSVCVGDIASLSPGVEKVLDPTTVPHHGREVSEARKALAMVSPEVRAAAASMPIPVLFPSASGSTESGMGIGLAISTPPVTQGSATGGARYTGPHPFHPTANIVTWHRLPLRANVQTVQTSSPASAGPGPSRESWMIYGAATEEDLMRSELQVVKEDAEAWSSRKSPARQQDQSVVTLTDAFRRQSVDSGLGSEEVHRSQNGGVEDMTFATGGTLRRLLSSASVSLARRARARTNPDSVVTTLSSVSRPASGAPSKTGFLIFEDEEAEIEEGVFRMDSPKMKATEARLTVQDSMLSSSPLLPTPSNAQFPASGSGSHFKPPPLLIFSSPTEPDLDKTPVRTPASRTSHRRVPSEARSERSWGRVYASENFGGLRSGMSSLESSPKMSPRPLGGVDDLEGYKDLFYSPTYLTKNNSPPNKSNISLAILIPENNKGNTNGGGSGSGSGPGFGKRPELVTFDSVRSGNSSASLSGRSLSAISAEVEMQRTRLEELEREHGKRWGSIMKSINGGMSPVPPEPFDPSSEGAEDTEDAPMYIEDDRPEETEEGGDFADSYRIITVQESLLPTTEFNHYRPRSTQLSVIEGSDDHLPDDTSLSVENLEQHSNSEGPESAPRRPSDVSTLMDDGENGSPLSLAQSATQRTTLSIPPQAIRHSGTAPSSVDPYHTRTSMATSGTEFSRMSGLSDFPAPPLNHNEFQLTPGELPVRQSYFQPPDSANGDASPSPTPLSPHTVEENDAGVHDRTRDSVSSSADELDLPSLAPQSSYRSTFGADDEVIRSWKASRDD